MIRTSSSPSDSDSARRPAFFDRLTPSISRQTVSAVLFTVLMITSLPAMSLMGGFGSGGVQADSGGPASLDEASSLDTADVDTSSTAEVDGTVYTSDEVSFKALDAATGEVEWEIDAGEFDGWEPKYTNLVVQDGIAITTTYDWDHDPDAMHVYAIDVQAGEIVWKQTTESFDDSKGGATIHGGVVYVGATAFAADIEAELLGYDLQTGEEVFSWNSGADLDSSMWGAVAVDGGVVYAHDVGEEMLYAFDADTHEELWRYETGIDTTTGNPTISDGVLYIGGVDGNEVLALDVGRQKPGPEDEVWRVVADNQVYGSVAVVDDLAYVGSDGGMMQAFDKETGEEVWNYTASGSVQSSATVYDGTVFFGSNDGNNVVYAVDAETGEHVWGGPAGGNSDLSTPTVYDGVVFHGTADESAMALDAETGDLLWMDETSSGEGSLTFSSDGSTSDGTRIAQEVQNHNDLGVSGQVVDQDGNPVPDATVHSWGVQPPQDTEDPRSLERQADEILESISDPLPDSYDNFLDDFEHSDGLIDPDEWADEVDATYPLVHQTDDYGEGYTTIIHSEIDLPRAHVDEGEDIIITLWDPTDEGLIQNPADNSFVGATTEGDVVVEQVSPTEEPIERDTYSTWVVYETSTYNPWVTEDHHGVYLNNPSTGVYRTYPEGHPERAYTFVVGDPDNLAETIEDDLRDEADELTERAQEIREMETEEVIVHNTTQTDADGNFNLDIDTPSAQVEAMKADGDLLEGTEDPSLSDLRQIQAQGYNGSFYLPDPNPTRVNPPESGVEVRTVRSPAVPYADFTTLQALYEWVEEQWYDDPTPTPPPYPPAPDPPREQLEAIYNTSLILLENLPDGEEKYLNESEFDEIQDAPDLDDGQLETEIGVMQTVLEDFDGIDPPDEPEDPIEIIDGELYAEYPIPSGLSDSVTVEIHWSDDTFETIDEEYWSVESGGFFGADAVIIDGYPIDEDDPAAFDLRILGAGDEGIIDIPIPGTNPAYAGVLPEIDAINLQTMTPGPSERVSVHLDAVPGGTYDELAAAQAHGPDGEELAAGVNTNTDRAWFETNGVGENQITMAFNSTDDETFAITETVRSYEQSRSNQPTVRVTESVLGTHAVVGEGLRSARVDTEDGDVSIDALIWAGQTAPGELHVQPNEALSGDDHEIEVSVLRGGSEEEVRSHVSIVTHFDDLDDDALIWVNGNAVTQGGETRWGEIDDRDNGKQVLVTFTDDRGQATIEVDEDPGTIARFWHWLDYSLPSPSIPVVGSIGPVVALDVATVDNVELPGWF